MLVLDITLQGTRATTDRRAPTATELVALYRQASPEGRIALERALSQPSRKGLRGTAQPPARKR